MRRKTLSLTSAILILLFACATVFSATTVDISGVYDVTGTSERGPNYDGALQVISHGEVYEFKWDVGDEYQGVGVINGNTVAVAWTAGNDGTGCGVVSYRMWPNGKLSGPWAMWGNGAAGWEEATRVKGTGLAGQYKVSGENPDESPYDTTLSITADGRGFEFKWGNDWSGYGIKQGNTISVGFGGEQCSWVAYEIKPGGVLDGIWGSYGSTNVGTERAAKRR
jgi:hypothetical protein